VLAATAAALLMSLMLGVAVFAQGSSDPPPAAPIVNDDGGAVRITGQVAYSYPYFTSGVAQPMVILEDQAGFVTRNEHFLMPVASQTIGQITSDFFTSPFTYSIATGIGLGFISYALIKVLGGRRHELNLAVVTVAVLFAIRFVVGSL